MHAMTSDGKLPVGHGKIGKLIHRESAHSSFKTREMKGIGNKEES